MVQVTQTIAPIKKANEETTNHSMLHILQIINAAIGGRANRDYAAGCRIVPAQTMILKKASGSDPKI